MRTVSLGVRWRGVGCGAGVCSQCWLDRAQVDAGDVAFGMSVGCEVVGSRQE